MRICFHFFLGEHLFSSIFIQLSSKDKVENIFNSIDVFSRSDFSLVKLCDFGSVRSAGDIVIKKVKVKIVFPRIANLQAMTIGDIDQHQHS